MYNLVLIFLINVLTEFTEHCFWRISYRFLLTLYAFSPESSVVKFCQCKKSVFWQCGW